MRNVENEHTGDCVVVTVAGRTFTVSQHTARQILEIVSTEPLRWIELDELWVASGVDEDIYRIWEQSAEDIDPNKKERVRYQLWWWDGPYTGMGMMGGDLRSADNAHNLAAFPSLLEAQEVAQNHFTAIHRRKFQAEDNRQAPLSSDAAVEFVPGRPNIYGLFYPNINGWYIGKNETGNASYMGSPSDAVRADIREAHLAAGQPELVEKCILWSPIDATRKECRDQEWIWIARFRAGHDGPVFNLFPTQDWSNHFKWVHDPETHVDRATNSRWQVVYMKLQASPNAEQNCDYRTCGRPWGAQADGLHWCKVIDAEGRETWLMPPSRDGNPYDVFRRHKLAMIQGEGQGA